MRLGKLVVYCALFVAACVPAYCQTELRVNIPFDFTVDNHTLPAGEYSVKCSAINGSETWRITGYKNSAFMLTDAANSPIVEHRRSLLFRRFGGQYTLAEFWMDGHSGREVVIPKLSKNMIAQSEYTLIAAEK